MKKSIFILFFSSLLLYTCVPHDQSGTASTRINKRLITDDINYEDNIRTVLLYPFTGKRNDAINPPIVPVNQTSTLKLEFDELGNNPQNYFYKILLCNQDWSLANVNSIQYMEDYNEFFVSERYPAMGTRVAYTHYNFFLPRVKISGNYLVVVYRNNNEDDIVLTRRFIAFENILHIAPDIKFSTKTSERNTSQQVDFIVSYRDYPVINPQVNLRMVVRQNHRWDNALTTLDPLYVREDIKRLEYTYFEGESNFKGGNEFRVFNISSARFSGINVDNVKIGEDYAEVYLRADRSRKKEAYTLWDDIDGKYFIDHYETGGAGVEPDYVYVNFYMASPHLEGKVYVTGMFTDWRLNKNYEMKWNEEKKIYSLRLLMKQGIYNYQYAYLPPNAKRADETYFEGSHSITQNQYDIIAYYRAPGSWTDVVIGYKNVNYRGSN